MAIDVHSARTMSLLETNSLKLSFFNCTTSEAEATAAAASSPKAKFLTVCISGCDESEVEDYMLVFEVGGRKENGEAEVDRCIVEGAEAMWRGGEGTHYLWGSGRRYLWDTDKQTKRQIAGESGRSL